MRSPAAIQASLAAGRCAACDAVVPVGWQTGRPCLCAACCETLAWCTGCQAPHVHAAFSRDVSRPLGLAHSCKAWLRAQSGPIPPCRRCGEPCASSRGAKHALCAVCLERFAWCSLCKRPRRRSDFRERIRAGLRHSGHCLRCDRERCKNGVREERSAAAAETYRRIAAYVKVHPRAGYTEIAVMLGVSRHQIRTARQRHNLTIGRRRQKEPRHANPQ